MDALISNEMRLVFRGKDASVSLRIDKTSKLLGAELLAMTVTVAGAQGMTTGDVFKAAISRAEEILGSTHRH